MSWTDWFFPQPQPNQDLTVLQNSIESLRNQMNAQSTNITSLTGKLADTQRRLGVVETQVAGLLNDRQMILDSMAALQEQINSVEGADLTSILEAMAGFHARANELNALVNAMSDNLTQFEELVIQQFESDA